MGFKITSIKIKNFKGFIDEEIQFNSNAKLIYIGGYNGFGKTTIMDAIEWCFTGKVTRICSEYNLRREGTYLEGLLRNTDHLNEETRIIINGLLGQEEISIERVFDTQFEENEGLRPHNTELYINGTLYQEITEHPQFKGIALDKLYDRYFCTYDKNIKLNTINRTDLAKIFYTIFDDAEQIELIRKNLNKVISHLSDTKGLLDDQRESKLKEYIEEKTNFKNYKNKLISPERIKEFENYPTKIFKNEKTVLELLNEKNKEGLIEYQKELLYKAQYVLENIDTYNKANKLLDSLKISLNKEIFQKDVITQYEKIKLLQKDILIDLFLSYDDMLYEIKEKQNTLKSINLNLIDPKEDLKDELTELKDLINSEELKTLANESISLFEKIENSERPSPSDQALETILRELDNFKEYQTHNDLCPLCGKPEFSTCTEIGIIANKTLNDKQIERAENIKLLESYLTSLKVAIQAQIKELNTKAAIYEEIIILKNNLKKWDTTYSPEEPIENIINQKLNEFKPQNIEEFSNLPFISQEPIIDYFDFGNDLYYSEIYIDDFIKLTTKDKIDYISKFIQHYKGIQNFIERNLIVQIFDSSIKNDIEIKIGIISEFEEDEYITNSQFIEFETEIKLIKEEIKRIHKERKQNKLTLKEHKNKNNEIDDKYQTKLKNINKCLKDIFENTFYRINRHTNFKRFEVRDQGRTRNNLSVFHKNKEGKDILISNILSTGQVSTMALSMIWSIINSQSKDNFRCYFFDDPIQSIDDLNILSFVDLLRVELLQENCIFDQLFITSCNTDFETLLLFKLDTFGIPYQHLKFIDYNRLAKA